MEHGLNFSLAFVGKAPCGFMSIFKIESQIATVLH